MKLPVLRQKPGFTIVLNVLQTLQTASPDDASRNEASRWLTSIIKNDLLWLDVPIAEDDGFIEPEEQREMIWDLASRRLAERCGRSAMGELTRKWIIPQSDILPELTFTIREPPMTGDNLGLKTWGTAFVVAKKLEYIGKTYLCHLVGNRATYDEKITTRSLDTQILELGSGTGLVGIAAAAIWGVEVTLTDLPEIQDNLQYNIHQNLWVVSEQSGAHMSGDILDWKSFDANLERWPMDKFKIVLAADPMYDDDHPFLVANAINQFLKTDEEARAFVAIPLRDSTTKLFSSQFEGFMREMGFDVVASGEEPCDDEDWERKEDVNVLVKWTIWQRQSLS